VLTFPYEVMAHASLTEKERWWEFLWRKQKGSLVWFIMFTSVTIQQSHNWLICACGHLHVTREFVSYLFNDDTYFYLLFFAFFFIVNPPFDSS